MPAINTESGARSAQPKKKVARKKPAPQSPAPRVVATPDQQDRAQHVEPGAKKKVVRRTPAAKARGRAPEEQQYLSQAHSVRVQAGRQKREAGTSPSGDRPQNRAREMTSPTVQEGVKQARLRVIRKRQSEGSRGTRTLKKELEGRGVLAALGKNLGERAETNIRTSGFGGQRVLKSGSLPDPAADIAVAAAKDLANFPASVPSGVYVPAAGAVEALQGRSARLKEFLRQIDESDPIYNTVRAGVAAIGGNSEEAKKRIDRALKAAQAHPGFTLLEVMGAGKGVDNAAGRAARTGVAGKTIRTATATRGAPKTVPGTNIEEARAYPKGLVQGQVKRYQEKTAREETQALRDRADAIRDTDPDTARELDAKATRKDPDRVQGKVIRRRVDERLDANESLRRIGRADVGKQVDEALKGVSRDVRPLVSLVAQRVVHADVDDLRAYVKELEAEHPHLDRAGRRANSELRARVEKALKKPDELAKVEEAAQKYAALVEPLQHKLVERGMLAADEADKAKLVPYAIRRLGAKHTNEHRIAAADVAKERLDNTRARVTRLEDERNRLRGAQSVTRGRDAAHEPQVAYKVGDRRFGRGEDAKAFAKDNGGDVERVSLTAREAKRQGEAARVERVLRKARADLRQHEGEYRDAKAARNQAELVDAAGKPLSAEQIRAHMKENDVPEPAYVTHAPSQRGARNFNIRSERAAGIARRRRTGEATRKGVFDIHPDTLHEGAARAQGLIDAADGFRGFIHEMGARGSSGKLKQVQTRAQAERVLSELNAIPGGHGFRAVQLNPFHGRQEQLESLMHDVNAQNQLAHGHGTDNPITAAITDALDSTKGDGPWAFIPEEAAGQLQAHLRTMGPGAAGKAGQVVGQAFRRTVLATSPSWMAGNAIEGAFRTALARGGARSYYTGRKVLKKMEQSDQQAAREAAVRTVGGGHFSSAERQQLHRTAEQFAGTNLEGIAQSLGKFWRAPGPKQAAQVWNSWTHLVFHTVNGTMERAYQTTILGAELRRSPLMSGHALKLSDKAMQDAADGLRGTNAQVEFGRAVDRAYGRYGKLGPTERAVIATYTPFVRWAMNATRFLVDVLPRDHPVVTGLLAATANATADWREEHGLAKFVDGAAPDWLQGSIPTSGGGHLRIAKFLPFSLGSDPLGSFAGQVLPQASSVLAAMKGEDWTGKKLRGKDGGEADDFQKLLAAAHALATSTVPILGQAERVKDKGAAALNPFEPVKPAAKKATKTVTKTPGAFIATYSPSSGSGAYDPVYKP